MNNKEKTIKIIKYAVCAVLLGLIIFATVKLWPFVRSGDIVETIRGYGPFGVLIFLALQLIQIFAAFIPGEPIEIAAGVLYGPWLGCLLCLVGIALGTAAIYYGTKFMGAKSIENNPKFDKYRFLKDPVKAERLVFILFLIPGTPKDILTYFGPFIPVKPSRYFIAAVFGRIPSVITSTLAGAAIYDGDIKMTIVYFAISALLAGAGLLINDAVTKRAGKAKDAETPPEA